MKVGLDIKGPGLIPTFYGRLFISTHIGLYGRTRQLTAWTLGDPNEYESGESEYESADWGEI